MEIIPLIAVTIDFTQSSIVYGVELNKTVLRSIKNGFTVSSNDIAYKDLVLKSTLLDKENQNVIFTTCNMLPHFYQGIYHKTNKRNLQEYRDGMDNIYSIGDVVGYLLFTK